MNEATRSLVRQRAGERCEYCHLPQSAQWVTFHIDHIVASQHQLNDRLDNLCLSCPQCNLYKGTNLSSIDRLSGEIVPLFHPREDAWDEHFSFRDHVVIGLTPTGRATVRLLSMNTSHRVDLRATLGIGK